jgi:hypothetical protein
MSAFDYVRAAATAHRLIAKFGRAITVRRTANSGTAWAPTLTATDYTATAAVLEYTARDIDGTLVKVGDRRVVISTTGLAIEPTTQDRLVIGGEEMGIVRVMKMSPAGVNVYFEVQARA